MTQFDKTEFVLNAGHNYNVTLEYCLIRKQKIICIITILHLNTACLES